MSSSALQVSVIVPAYNAEESIELCLQALTRQTIPSARYEIIVVDDNSTDQTKARVEAQPHVRLLTQPHAGPAAARNLGARQASGEILLFTDADCIPSEDWMEKMLAPFSQEEIVGVKGVYTSLQRSLTARFVQLEYEDKYDRMRRQKYIDFIDTYSAGYRRDVFLANGGFDPFFPTASVEDQEFSFRLAHLGYKMVFEPQAKVCHTRHASSLKGYARKKFRIGYWKVRVHQKHPDKLIADSHTPQALKLQILTVGAGSLLLILAGIAPYFRWLSVVAWGGFVLTILPFVSKAMRKDRMAALVSPGLLLLRAYALGLGFFFGVVKQLPVWGPLRGG